MSHTAFSMPDLPVCDDIVLKYFWNIAELDRVAYYDFARSDDVRDRFGLFYAQEGLGIWSHAAGLFGQRLYFYSRTKHYTSKLKIDQQKCIGIQYFEFPVPLK